MRQELVDQQIGARRQLRLYIVLVDPDGAGPATRDLERRIREQVATCGGETAAGHSRY